MDAIPTLGQINIYIGILNPEASHYTIIIHLYCFVHPIFRFWFLVTFGDEVTKILRNLCLHFARQDGQDGEKPERKSCN